MYSVYSSYLYILFNICMCIVHLDARTDDLPNPIIKLQLPTPETRDTVGSLSLSIHLSLYLYLSLYIPM